MTFDSVLDKDIRLGVALKALPTKGNLVYEYNPFLNYRLTQNMYLYKGSLYSLDDLKEKEGITMNGTDSWIGVPKNETDPIPKEAGELVDFTTDELNFDLNHPVDILPQYSYDGSVNLILNDGKNIPRLVNSRFTALGKNQYEIIDRSGDNDTNIYDQGTQFDIDTSLYKRVINIPKLNFLGVYSGGNLKVGNYHFYFKYADADGNETDFIAESGLVSVFIGSTPDSIHSGFSDYNSKKLVKFYIENIDSAYQYVNVYYTRETSDYKQNPVTEVGFIKKKFIVNNALNCDIVITGYEEIQPMTLADINIAYNIASAADTQAVAQNRLFLGNIKKKKIDYKELKDLSLRFLPTRYDEAYELEIDRNYSIQSNTLGYYDPKYIYNKVGYWGDEIYRFGIVYILYDNSLSDVFNIRGIDKLSTDTVYSSFDLYKDGERNYIPINEIDNRIIPEGTSVHSNTNLENSKGVVRLTPNITQNIQHVYGIKISTSKEVLQEISKHAKGFFFVRQKRIPTTICQALTIGIDQQSKTPVLPVQGANSLVGKLRNSLKDWTGSTNVNSMHYVSERFLNNDQKLTNEFLDRLYLQSSSSVKVQGAICPDYDVSSERLNNLFTGDDFKITLAEIQPSQNYFSFQDSDERHFYNPMEGTPRSSLNYYQTKILGIEDGTKLASIGKNYFAAMAGQAEEAYRFEYINKEDKTDNATNLLRGLYGPYLGITGFNEVNKIINIKIPGYQEGNMEDYFNIRYNDDDAFYAMSDRISLIDLLQKSEFKNKDVTYVGEVDTCYRGDCYICQFTHRINRNFQDPSNPSNHEIVDDSTWKDNYKRDDSEQMGLINLGDVNAVKLGMWITFTVRSNYNLCVRALDDSIPDEQTLMGQARGFYPYYDNTANGNFKTPEALCYNFGFGKAVSNKWNFEVPDVPYIKQHFENTIIYSDVNVNDAFKNGFRVFQLKNYKDFPKTYGSIVKLVELFGSLLCVFEHGVALIPINERAVAGNGHGGDIYINTPIVLPDNPKILSDKFGSQWEESIIKTPYYVYGVDTVGKKIWRTNGSQFECISDFKVQKFLNDHITLTERELTPIIGVRNVKSHYNAFKQDVMFTFYDNLHGFNEKVWSLCWNEVMPPNGQWVSFYSWIPSYSENIDNMYFSFDRDTSKWIAKLGVSKHGNDFSDGITLSNNIIGRTATAGTKIGDLHIDNRILPNGSDSDGNPINYQIEYSLERDIFGNYKNFYIQNGALYLNTSVSSIESEFYERENDKIKTDSRGIRVRLKEPINSHIIVSLLNIKATINILTDHNDDPNIKQYIQGYNEYSTTNAGFFESQVAVIPEWNMQFLTTDFWKHGRAGIIDIADDILPTFWYGKQHPFEFEVVVADNPQSHKIFNNLQIISNKAKPESFHYEIVGDCFDFAWDKPNMYVRQEITKDLYQYNGSNITYDSDFGEVWDQVKQYPVSELSGDDELLGTESGMLSTEDGDYILINASPYVGKYRKSTLFPLYYQRHDSINEVYDYYKQLTVPSGKDYDHLAGAELVRYKDLQEFRICNHVKAVDIKSNNRLRGNMHYKEDIWDIQINPIVFVEKNETKWNTGTNGIQKVPIIIGNSPVPDDLNKANLSEDDIPKDLKEYGYTMSGDIRNDVGVFTPVYDIKVENWSNRKECKIKDKFVKIRIRYTGNELAVITALKTLYAISYS